jgi:hypothetical protein
MRRLGWGLALGTLLAITILESRKKTDGFVRKCKNVLKKKIDNVIE